MKKKIQRNETWTAAKAELSGKFIAVDAYI